jgi:hypothetical protein
MHANQELELLKAVTLLTTIAEHTNTELDRLQGELARSEGRVCQLEAQVCSVIQRLSLPHCLVEALDHE